LTPDRLVPLVLIKATVCRLLESKLLQSGFTVLNNGIVIPFPAYGWQQKFRGQFDVVLKAAASG
jgi:hypothetical protein